MSNLTKCNIQNLIMMLLVIVCTAVLECNMDTSIIEKHIINEIVNNNIQANLEHHVECAKFDKGIALMDKRLEDSKKYLREIHDANIKYIRPTEFDPDDVRISSNATAEELNDIVKGTNLAGIGEACVYVEQEYGINAITVLALSIHESGFGTNAISKHKNNIISYRATNKNTFRNAKTFSSKSDCIVLGMRSIAKNYLDINGKYFHGFGLTDMNVRYALLDSGGVNYEWSSGITKLSYKYQSLINQQRIDKYKNYRVYR